MMKLIVFKTLNAPAKAGGFYQLMENKKGATLAFNLSELIFRRLRRRLSERQ